MKNIIFVMMLLSIQSIQASLIQTHPRFANLSPKNLDYIDTVVKQAIEQKDILGAVVFATRNESVVYKKAFGSMRCDTICDVGTLSRFVGVIPCLLLMAERGQITLLEAEQKNICNKTLELFAQDNIFTPVGMKDTKLVYDDETKQEPHLLTTATDLALFCNMLVSNGQVDKKTVMSPAAANKLLNMIKTGNALEPNSLTTIRGDFLHDACGQTNLTGSSFLIDMQSKMTLVVLLQPATPEKVFPTNLPAKIANILAGSIKLESAQLNKVESTKSRH